MGTFHDARCPAQQVEKEKDSLRLELSNAKSNINDAEAALASQKAQLEKLNHVVAEADAGANILFVRPHIVGFACVAGRQ